ncbi:sigma-70 family RNA polymerase sigma factor [Chitinophaga sedimenti]|uniref:RNA polymerase sigma factor n=1 Tax=Chitinophaga sedimenti TaxID=2033606 RepID=UPI0020043556|nr:sigma-70 family RNA polymerase sigma factor [Chitinophaga sedimenti]MCK7553739.1 sigma-70 family RNA polymerase sigma factor [Chitinophaga sedimenti]
MKEEADENAYAELYERYSLKLYRRALKLTRDEEQAKDTTQDALLILWENRENIEIDMDQKVSSYLYRVVFHKSTHLIDRAKVAANYREVLKCLSLQGANAAESNLTLKELYQLINRGLEEMPDNMKHVFVQSRFEDKSHKLISEEMNIPYNTVKDLIKKRCIAFA